MITIKSGLTDGVKIWDMRIERELDDQAVEAAEFHRKHNQLKEAVGVTSTAFGFPSNPLTTAEVSLISHGLDQRIILACLARIHVDSYKSLANISTTPWDVLSRLEQASWAIGTIFRNPVFKTLIGDAKEDHRGRQHLFKAEMSRDIAKTLEATVPLYSPQFSDNLLNLAVVELDQAYRVTDNNFGVRPLISMERQILQTKKGAGLDFERLLQDFSRLAFLDQENNPHRVASVASRLVVWGEKLGSREVQEKGLAVFGEIAQEHPEWGFILEAEKERLDKEAKRERRIKMLTPLARLSSPLTNYSSRCQELYEDLMDKDYYLRSFR